MTGKRRGLVGICLACFLLLICMPFGRAFAANDTTPPTISEIAIKDRRYTPRSILELSTNPDEPTLARDSFQIERAHFEFGPELADGDSFSFGFVPKDEDFKTFAYIFSGARTKFQSVSNESGAKIADINITYPYNTLKLTFTSEVDSADKTNVDFNDINFSVESETVLRWLAAHSDDPRVKTDAGGKKYVDVAYDLQINGERAAGTSSYYVRYSEPEYEPPTYKVARKYGGAADANSLIYVVELNADLDNTNELIMYDTPDVNLAWKHDLEISRLYAPGKVRDSLIKLPSSALTQTGYYNITQRTSDRSAANAHDLQIYAYDVYIKATREGYEQSRQATFTSSRLPIMHFDPTKEGNAPLPEAYQTSIQAGPLPQDILLEKPAGAALSEEEQALIVATDIEGDKGLSSEGKPGAVVKGMKLVVQNLPKNIEGHQFYKFQYTMDTTNKQVAFTNDNGEPMYWNSAAYYFQEIPSCTDDNTCTPVRALAATPDEVYKIEGGRGLTVVEPLSHGSVSGSTEQLTGTVVVKYRVEGSSDTWLRSPKVLSGNLGSTYNLEDENLRSEYMPAELQNGDVRYAFVAAATGDGLAEVQGTFKSEKQTIILEYAPKAKASLTVKYRLEGTEDSWLADEKSYIDYEGEAYDLTSAVNKGTYMPDALEKDGSNYSFVRVAEGGGLAPATGSLKDGALVILEYKKKSEEAVPEPEPKPEPKPEVVPEPKPEATPEVAPQEPASKAEPKVQGAKPKAQVLPKTADVFAVGAPLTAMLSLAGAGLIAAARKRRH